MTTGMCRSLAALMCATVVGAEASAFAQGSPDVVAQASEHFTRGVRLYQEDDFRTALIEFSRAYELAPNPAVLFDLYNEPYDYDGNTRLLWLRSRDT